MDAARPEARVQGRAAIDRRFTGFVLCVLLPVAWLGLTPPFYPPYQAVKRTRTMIKQDSLVVHEFLGKYKRTPADLSSLRSFAQTNRLPFAGYDAFGQHLDYLRLDDQHYLLRSFGEDQVQNSATSAPDMGIVHWGERPNAQLIYEPPELAEAGFYPSALLPGADAPNLAWLARVFVDPANRARHLVARHLTKTGLFMVAPHDQVEEFFWMPSGEQVVFTATASARYRDGLYLWDLRTDQVVNLLDKVRRSVQLGPATGGDRFWLSLAGIGRRGPTVLTYLHSRHDGSVAPEDFFNPEHLLAIAVPGEQPGRARLATAAEYALPKAAVAVRKRLNLHANLAGGGGLAVQRRWLGHSFEGAIEELLVATQAWSMKSASTPLFPYSLWILAALYSEGAEAIGPGDAAAKESLRAYGAEIARALLNYPVAPSYLKGLALSAYETLMDGRALPYRFAQFPVVHGLGVGPETKPHK